jgi:hypothetical protein
MKYKRKRGNCGRGGKKGERIIDEKIKEKREK